MALEDEIDEEEYHAPLKAKKKVKAKVETLGNGKKTTQGELATTVEIPEEAIEEEKTAAQLASESLDGGGVTALSTRKLRKKLAEYTEEYQFLAPDISHAAVARRIELWRLQRVCQDLLDAREEIVEVKVPRSPMGHPYVVGPRSFEPGVYRLRASIASYLLWLIGESQRVEMQRLQMSSRAIDLGTVGERAKQIHAAITREG
jgi:hypothetical protein